MQMVTDSLRYWVQEMHVDGFRFDLGTILAREPHGFDEQSGFLMAVSQDPLLNTVKLIAEPWFAAPAATRSEVSRRAGRSGTTSSATRCAIIGAARHRLRRSRRALPPRATCSTTAAGAPGPR